MCPLDHFIVALIEEISVFKAISGLRTLTVLLALLEISACPCWAQNSAPTDQETISSLIQQIKELQEHDRELQERVRLLEAGQKESTDPVPSPQASAPGTAETPGQPPSIQPPSIQPQAASAPDLEMHDLHGIRWRGFAEADYKVLDTRAAETGTYGFVPGSAGSFFTGDFNLFLTSRLTPRTSVLSEIDFEEADAQSYKLDLRRILLKYDYNDHLRLAFGRYQTSIGYYNWEFRSATWLQTTADRPLVMEFATNGGILPTQAVGVSVTGSIPSGRLGLSYVAEYGSSDTIRPDINGAPILNDENNGNQINVGFYLQPDWVQGLRIGGSFYHDQISELVQDSDGDQIVRPTDSQRWNQSIVNGHVVYVGKGFEFLNEGFFIRHALIGGSTVFNTSAFYTQVSKAFKRVRPFFRYQYVNASSSNVIYDDIGYRAGPSVGVRFDMNEYFAFKVQLDHTLRRGLPDIDGLHLQLAATF